MTVKNLRLNSTACCIPCVVAKATSELHEEFWYVWNVHPVVLVKKPLTNGKCQFIKTYTLYGNTHSVFNKDRTEGQIGEREQTILPLAWSSQVLGVFYLNLSLNQINQEDIFQKTDQNSNERQTTVPKGNI